MNRYGRFSCSIQTTKLKQAQEGDFRTKEGLFLLGKRFYMIPNELKMEGTVKVYSETNKFMDLNYFKYQINKGYIFIDK